MDFNSPFVPLLLMIAVMYFMIFLPKQKEMKKLQETIKALQTGDKIITQSGIYGTVHVIREESLLLKLEDGATMEILKSAVAKKNEA